MIDTRDIVSRLHTIESLAVIPRVASTNLVARRIVTECMENELSLPQAMIIAREQLAGRGRNQRSWSSPRGKGIYATTLLTRTAEEMALMPLTMATIIAEYLSAEFGIDAGIKWPNDIFAGGRKIAGILIEGRVHENRGYLAIGTGVNLEPVQDDTRPNAVSVREVAAKPYTNVDDAIVSFIEHVDAGVTRRDARQTVLEAWRARAIHRPGDPVKCVIGERTIEGTWSRIDDDGRAV
ncbi:MAG TPA: biotin--[acetyl-CoA-carboxylase] ligase, partial [Thermoanaerobaculia bacterium]|nr:biotin--[acetyl-CoA-carboxylase] ligase [Thermoanaerobaculia bacterium]